MLRLSRLMTKAARQARSSSPRWRHPHLKPQEASVPTLGPEGSDDLALDGPSKKQASIAAAAVLMASSGQATEGLVSKHREPQGMYEELCKQCDELEARFTRQLPSC